jgi:hypothetical protein
MECVKEAWEKPTRACSSSAILSEKFKSLRSALKKWKTSLSQLKVLISKCNIVILYFDELEEERPLCVHESNFRKLVKLHLEKLLKA